MQFATNPIIEQALLSLSTPDTFSPLLFVIVSVIGAGLIASFLSTRGRR